jgi:hypothetical protein
MQFSCQDEGYLNSPDIELKFTTDTIMFDTVFTNFGSATKKLSIYNPYRESVLISKLKLHGAEFSSFNLNYNGKSKTEYLDIEVPARDSIAVYIVVTIDPTGRNLPLIVQDSVEIAYNGLKKCLKLVAYGQDFVLVKGRNLKNTVWTNEKPYLVYNYAYVDSVAELIIQPGARIFFHKGSGLYVKGKITAKGNLQNPISFSSDKLEPEYKNTPDLWNGIVLYSGSHENVFDYVNIRNANIGIQVGNIEKEGFASVQLSNTRIENMSYAGIFALKSKILAYNTVVANCGLYSVALLAGGKYEFYHSTLSNYRGVATSKMRSSPSLVISNFLPVRQFDGKTTVYSYDLESATFGNSIIYGNSPKEIETGNNGKNKFNYRFDHCLIQMPDTFDISNREIYRNIYKGSRSKPKFIDPVRLNLTLDTLSAAKDAGSSDIAKRFPLDFYRKDRTSDLAPDLGAYERIEKKKSN